MRELLNDPFYELIKTYDRCIMDFCLIENETSYCGYRSHKEAILFAMCKVIERCTNDQLKAELEFHESSPEDIDDEPFPWSLDIAKANAKHIDPQAFLHVPDIIKKDRSGEQIPYWYAFLNAPHGTGYGPDDFKKINEVLFPNGAQSLEVYEWTTDWSNYFNDGHEWWGAACWSVYDKAADRFTVLMASTTD